MLKKLYVYPRVEIPTHFRKKGHRVTWDRDTKLRVIKAGPNSFEVKPAGKGYKNTLEVNVAYLDIVNKDGKRLSLLGSAFVVDIFIALFDR